MEYSQKQINFLDVLKSENDKEGSLIASLFTKSTDTHQYLNGFVQMKMIFNGNCWI